MTDATDHRGPEFDLREQLARIDRAQAEAEKLREETRKFVSEGHKYSAETRRLDREYRYFPWLQLATSGAIAALVAAAVAHWR